MFVDWKEILGKDLLQPPNLFHLSTRKKTLITYQKKKKKEENDISSDSDGAAAFADDELLNFLFK